MLKAVTLTEPDLDAIAAEPWPGDEEKVAVARRPWQPMAAAAFVATVMLALMIVMMVTSGM